MCPAETGGCGSQNPSPGAVRRESGDQSLDFLPTPAPFSLQGCLSLPHSGLPWPPPPQRAISGLWTEPGQLRQPQGRGSESDLGSNAGTGGLGIASRGLPDAFARTCLQPECCIAEGLQGWGSKGLEIRRPGGQKESLGTRPWTGRSQNPGFQSVFLWIREVCSPSAGRGLIRSCLDV